MQCAMCKPHYQCAMCKPHLKPPKPHYWIPSSDLCCPCLPFPSLSIALHCPVPGTQCPVPMPKKCSFGVRSQVWCHTILYSTMQYHAIPCNVMLHHAIPYNTVLHRSIPVYHCTAAPHEVQLLQGDEGDFFLSLSVCQVTANVNRNGKVSRKNRRNNAYLVNLT